VRADVLMCGDKREEKSHQDKEKTNSGEGEDREAPLPDLWLGRQVLNRWFRGKEEGSLRTSHQQTPPRETRKKRGGKREVQEERGGKNDGQGNAAVFGTKGGAVYMKTEGKKKRGTSEEHMRGHFFLETDPGEWEGRPKRQRPARRCCSKMSKGGSGSQKVGRKIILVRPDKLRRKGGILREKGKC